MKRIALWAIWFAVLPMQGTAVEFRSMDVDSRESWVNSAPLTAGCEAPLATGTARADADLDACMKLIAWKLYAPVKTRRLRPILVLRNSLIA